MKNILVYSFLFVLLFSCTSTKGRIGKLPVPIEQISALRIRKYIENGDLSNAMQDISSAQRDTLLLSAEQLDDLKKEVIEKYNFLFSDALENNNYFDAYKFLVSAETAGLTLKSAEGLDKNILIGKIVFSDTDNLTFSAKLAYARKYFDITNLKDSVLKRIIDLCAAAEDSETMKFFLPELEKRGFIHNSEYDEILNRKYSNLDLIKGTVTIWVNRGMRIEKGMGLPDRVIGSGFFIDKEGYLLTNYHVIESEVDPEYEGYSRLYVKLSENTKEKIPAKVIGWDKIFDIALLKVSVKPETVFYFGKERKYDPGTPIIAIGSPGGLENTITSGIISAYGRKFLQLGTVLQVDVPINHGNSGGPLLDKDNELVGVVFAGIEQFEGINFAIPGYYVSELLPQLYSGGEVEHPFLGLSLYEKDDNIIITYVTPNGSSARAGIESGDLLVSVNGHNVKTIDEIQRILLLYEPGMLIKASWKHGDQIYEGLLNLSERPDLPVKDAYENDATESLFFPVFGMKVKTVSSNLFSKSFIITKILEGSIADDAGLSVNDPFTVQKIKEDTERNILHIEIRIKKRKSGFLESGLLLSTYMGTGDFI